MMKNICFAVIFSFLLLAPVFQVTAQSSSGSSSSQTFDTTNFPQWAKDMRRWDIIAFGSFPFALFTVTFFTDLARWNNANNMNFTDEGLRYAPWPLKTTGAVEMTKEEYERTLLIAAGLSAVIAFTDLIIVKIKQSRERRRIESKPSGSVIINRIPYEAIHEEGSEDPGGTNDTGKISDIGEPGLE